MICFQSPLKGIKNSGSKNIGKRCTGKVKDQDFSSKHNS